GLFDAGPKPFRPEESGQKNQARRIRPEESGQDIRIRPVGRANSIRPNSTRKRPKRKGHEKRPKRNHSQRVGGSFPAAVGGHQDGGVQALSPPAGSTCNVACSIANSSYNVE